MNTHLDHPLRYSVHTRLREHHLKKMMPAKRTGRFLDVGCGAGYLTSALGQGFMTVGVDQHEGTLVQNQARGLGIMVNSEAFALPFVDGCFNLVLCSEVLEHLPPGKDQSALGEMGRVLATEGVLLITVPASEGLRSGSRLRNLGHDVPGSGEYHYRKGYRLADLYAMVSQAPELSLVQCRSAMFLLSELLMDLSKLAFHRKHQLKEHADLAQVGESGIFRLYRRLYPLLHMVFLCEDALTCRLGRGHIHLLALRKKPA